MLVNDFVRVTNNIHPFQIAVSPWCIIIFDIRTNTIETVVFKKVVCTAIVKLKGESSRHLCFLSVGSPVVFT
jgi:hypothetical protein